MMARVKRAAAVAGAVVALVLLNVSSAAAQTTPDPVDEAAGVVESLGTEMFDVLRDLMGNPWVAIVVGFMVALPLVRRLLRAMERAILDQFKGP